MGCRQLSARRICGPCAQGFTVVPPRIVGAGLPVWSAYRHAGLARRLVHDLKYRSVLAAADVLATAMVPHLPPTTAALVPVPRVVFRRVMIGIDPGLELARAISRRCDVPLVMALRAPLWRPGQAGKGKAGRRPTAFARHRRVIDAVLIDDVVTTGATLLAASRALAPGVVGAVTATGVCV